MNTSTIEFVDQTFLYWTAERERIRKARASGLPRSEWTTDLIFRKNRFCNVSREHDRTTIWVKENIRDPFNADGDWHNLFIAVSLARFLNMTPVMQHLIDEDLLVPGKPLDLHGIAGACREFRAADPANRMFSSAYMVGAPPNSRMYKYGHDKIAYVCGVLEHAVLPEERTREGFVKSLSKQFGYAEFMSGQIAADLAYTDVLRDAPDHLTWSPRGPGAMRGMNRALIGPQIDKLQLKKKIPEAQYLAIGRAQMAMLPEGMVEELGLTLHDIASNMNCETDKYLRGGGTRLFK